MARQIGHATYTRAVPPALISAASVGVNYRGSGTSVTALHDLDVLIPGSGITCLLGANGAGKTTLLEAASGLRAISSGQLRVLDSEPGSALNRGRLGVMLQDGGIPGSARPEDFLRYIARLYPIARRPADLLDLLEIADCARTPIRRLSGGESARVAWAAAMIGNPSAMLLDEPTASLDPTARSRMHDVLRAEAQSGTAICVSTHLVEDVVALADHVVVLASGTVALSGSLEQLRPRNRIEWRGPRHMSTATLMDALPAGSACREIDPGHYRVEVSDDVDPSVVATVTAWCAQHDVLPDISIADVGTVLREAIDGSSS